ncbi:Fc.00g059000.m01.CDS01 [Cosmosporella sp. VM-42]
MSTPRTKRLFAGASADPSQRQITSFFNPRNPADASEAERPILPSSVEANLLSVGMRIRKSVPEGYKTVGPSAFKLWTDNAPLPVQSATGPAGVKASSRELLPFCGINKVGGLDTQPEFEVEHDDVPGLDAIPGLTMSQESADGMDAAQEVSRKRIFDEDEDALNDAGALATSEYSNARILAVPKSRTKKALAYRDIGQENVTVDNDFLDAEFLVYSEEEMTN